MKPFLVFLFVVSIATTLSGCEGLFPTPTAVSSKTYAVANFDALRISSNMTADIQLGTQFGVTATGVERDLADLRVVVSGGRLTIDYPTWYAHRKAMNLRITLPVLKAVDLSGSVKATLSGITETPAFGVDLSGTSHFEGAVRTGRLVASLTGNTDLRLMGQATQSVIDASGNTKVYAFGLQTDETRLSLTGQSYAEIAAAKQLSVRASGQTRVRYRGMPQTDFQITGQSQIERQ